MAAARYRFTSAWWLPAAPGPVFDALVDLATYPLWWPDIRSVREVDPRTAELVCRSSLPYRMTLRMRRIEQDETAGALRVELGGDLAGWLAATVQARDGGTAIDIEQQVDVRKPLLRRLSPVARPVFRMNHTLMMRRGRAGLTKLLGDMTGEDMTGEDMTGEDTKEVR